jgi:hypothetical protein
VLVERVADALPVQPRRPLLIHLPPPPPPTTIHAALLLFGCRRGALFTPEAPLERRARGLGFGRGTEDWPSKTRGGARERGGANSEGREGRECKSEDATGTNSDMLRQLGLVA